MSQCRTRKRFRCRFCGQILNAWQPLFQEPDGTMLLGHLSRNHPDQVGRYLDQMHTTEDITLVAAQAFELVEGDQPEDHERRNM
jgi:hypothetical protein